MRPIIKSILIVSFMFMGTPQGGWATEKALSLEDFMPFVFNTLQAKATRIGSTAWTVELDLGCVQQHKPTIKGFFEALPSDHPLFPDNGKGPRGAFTNKSLQSPTFDRIKKSTLETALRDLIQNDTLKPTTSCAIGSSLRKPDDFQFSTPSTTWVSPEIDEETTRQFSCFCQTYFVPFGFSIAGLQIAKSGHVLRNGVDVDTTPEKALFEYICTAWANKLDPEATAQAEAIAIQMLKAQAEEERARARASTRQSSQSFQSKPWSDVPLGGKKIPSLSAQLYKLLAEEGLAFGKAFVYESGEMYISGLSNPDENTRAKVEQATRRLSHFAAANNVKKQMENLTLVDDMKVRFLTAALPIPASFTFDALPSELRTSLQPMQGTIDEVVRALKAARSESEGVEKPLNIGDCLRALEKVGPLYERWKTHDQRLQQNLNLVPFSMRDDPDYKDVSFKRVLVYLNEKARRAVDEQVQQLETVKDHFTAVREGLTELTPHIQNPAYRAKIPGVQRKVTAIIQVCEANLGSLQKPLAEITDVQGRKNRPDYLYGVLEEMKAQTNENEAVLKELGPLVLSLAADIKRRHHLEFADDQFRSRLIRDGYLKEDK